VLNILEQNRKVRPQPHSHFLKNIYLNVALNRQLGVLPNLYPVGKSAIYGGDMRKMFIIEGEVKVISFLTGFTKRIFPMFYG